MNYIFIEIRLFHVKVFCLFLLNLSLLICPTSGRVVVLETGKREVPGSNPCRACPFGVFRGSLRNSRKYGLGSLRMTHHGENSSLRPRSQMRIISFNPITTNQPNSIVKFKIGKWFTSCAEEKLHAEIFFNVLSKPLNINNLSYVYIKFGAHAI